MVPATATCRANASRRSPRRDAAQAYRIRRFGQYFLRRFREPPRFGDSLETESLAEIGWVLAGAYGWDRAIIHGRIQRLVRTRNVFVEDVDLVDEALEEYREGRAELADYLILGKARERADELLTFNRKLAKEQGASLL